jgi:hypothetical protein
MVALILAICLFAVFYFLDNIGKVVYNFSVQKNSLDTFFNREGYLRSLTDDYFFAEDGINTLRGSFISENKAIDFIKEMENMLDKTNNMGKITIMPSDEKEGVLEAFRFQIQLFGNFPNLMSFLTELENGKYQAVVKRFAVNKISGSGGIESLLKLGKIDYDKSDEFGNPLFTISSVLDIEAYIID